MTITEKITEYSILFAFLIIYFVFRAIQNRKTNRLTKEIMKDMEIIDHSELDPFEGQIPHELRNRAADLKAAKENHDIHALNVRKDFEDNLRLLENSDPFGKCVCPVWPQCKAGECKLKDNQYLINKNHNV